MKIFRLEWTDYDCYSSWLFSHNDKTDDQFKDDVEFLLKKYGDEYLTNEDSWAGASNWIKLIAKKLPELGYDVIEPVEWGFFGGSILYNDEKMDRDDNEWFKIVGENFVEKCKLHNQKIQDELDGKYKKR